MGSTYEPLYVPGDQTYEEAYRQAVRDAIAEYGHDSYNGTISTGGGIRLHSAVPVSLAQAKKIAYGREDHLQKWETWEAQAVAAGDHFTKREIDTSIRLDVDQIPYGDELTDLLTPLVCRAGEHLTRVAVTTTEIVWRSVTVPVEGERRIVYRIEGCRRPVGEEFASIAEARAALMHIAKTWGTPRPGWDGKLSLRDEEMRPLDARIVGTVDRGAGQPLVRIGTKVKRRVVRVEATALKPKPGAPKLGGWMLYGWAAC